MSALADNIMCWSLAVFCGSASFVLLVFAYAIYKGTLC